MLFTNCISTDELKKLCDKAFTKNANAMRFDYLSKKDPNIAKNYIGNDPHRAAELQADTKTTQHIFKANL